MKKSSSTIKKGASLLKSLLELGGLLITGAAPILRHLGEGLDGKLDHYAGITEKRLIALALRGSGVFLSALLVVAGVLLVAVDYGGVPRGIACLGAGALGLTVFFILGLIKK